MACCLTRYKDAWDRKYGKRGPFTGQALRQQLRRCLAAYEHLKGDPDRELAGFMTNKPLTKLFDQKLASAVPFSYFLPWTEATFPCTILPNDTMDNL